MSLQGTTVLVTGAGGGLGKVIASTYLDAGANVAICDINDERLSAVKEEFDSTGRFVAIKTDVTDESAVDSLVSEVVSKFGGLDILVNNAGLMDIFDPIGELKKKTWDNIISVNLTGSFLCMKAAVNAFQKQAPRGGLILQIGSNASYMGFCAGTAYTVSKHGVAALVKSTAGFYGDEGIYAVGLMLGGMVDTNIADSVGGLGGFNQQGYGKVAAENPFSVGNAVQLKDVAKYCIFLSDRSIAATANGSCVPFNKNWPKA